MATISYEHDGNKVEITVKECDEYTPMTDFVDLLVKPMLLAIGYSHLLVDRLYVSDEDEK